MPQAIAVSHCSQWHIYFMNKKYQIYKISPQNNPLLSPSQVISIDTWGLELLGNMPKSYTRNCTLDLEPRQSAHLCSTGLVHLPHKSVSYSWRFLAAEALFCRNVLEEFPCVMEACFWTQVPPFSSQPESTGNSSRIFLIVSQLIIILPRSPLSFIHNSTFRLSNHETASVSAARFSFTQACCSLPNRGSARSTPAFWKKEKKKISSHLPLLPCRLPSLYPSCPPHDYTLRVQMSVWQRHGLPLRCWERENGRDRVGCAGTYRSPLGHMTIAD